MQLLKQIWNERRSNGWLWAELLIVFVVLWYIVDLTYVTARQYYEPLGFDITDTYYLELGLKDVKSDSYISKAEKTTTLGQDLMEMATRLRMRPEVEAVSISLTSRPYNGSNSGNYYGIDADTLKQMMLIRRVTPDFFRVFRYQSADGRRYEPLVQAITNNQAVVSENIWDKDYTGDRTLPGHELVDIYNPPTRYKIGGVSTKVRYNDFWPNYSDKYVSMRLEESELAELESDMYPANYELCLRVKPGTPADFPQWIKKLTVGNLFIIETSDFATLRESMNQYSVKQVQTRLWVVGFLLVNILLGVIGTFWFRTQYRRSELGLRMALGSGKRQVWGRLNSEGVWLLTLATVPAVVVCFNIGYMDLVNTSLPWGASRFLVGLLFTYLLMVCMILIGIWFPARQAMRIDPAEALHEE